EGGKTWPVAVQLREADADGAPRGPVLYEAKQELVTGGARQFSLPASVTKLLAPGAYTLLASSPGLTPVPLRFFLGNSGPRSPFHFVLYGDYGPTYPVTDVWDTPDAAAAHAARLGKAGFNLTVDRLGAPM